MSSVLARAKTILSSHKRAIFYALVVGMLFTLPQVLARIELGGAYQGAPFLYQSDDENYLANIEDILDGHVTASSPIYFGYKDSPAVILPFGEYLYVLPSVLLHIPILLVVELSKFAFPALLFLLVYALVFSLTQRDGDEEDAKLGAVAGGLLVLLGYDFVDPAHVHAVITGAAGIGYSTIWARLVNPISGGLFLFLFLMLLWKLFNGKTRLLPYAAGVLLAVMTGYVFSFGVGLSVTALLCVIAFAQKKPREAWSFVKVIGLGVLPATASGLFVLFSQAASAGGSTLAKAGLLHTHVPLVNRFLLLALVAFALVSAWLFLKRSNLLKDSAWWWFSFAFLVGTFLTFIQQVVTGVTVWPQHLVQYSIPVVYVVGMVVLYRCVRPWSRSLWAGLTYVILIASLAYGALVVSSYRTDMAAYASDQRYVPVYAWLNSHTANGDCVVLVSEKENYLSGKIPAYTHCDDYYSVQNYYGVPQDRIESGYLLWLRVRGITVADVHAYLESHRPEVRSTMFTNWLELWHASGDPWLQAIQVKGALAAWEDAAAARLETDYLAFLKGDFKAELEKYKLDYVVWDKAGFPAWNPQDFPSFTEVYAANGLVIFSVHS